jgi:sensor histidine kinase regulating citrate/malate metabolism
VGFTLTFFVLTIFNESWLLSSIFYAPSLTLYMYKTGSDLLGNEVQELAVRSVFCILIYAVIAFRVEVMSKQSFMGRESSEKAFHRWMKIFETFPEGIALIRNNYILYANKAVKTILEVGLNRSPDDDPIYDLLRGDLENTKVTPWVKNPELLKQKGIEPPKETTVWNFLQENQRGAIF